MGHAFMSRSRQRGLPSIPSLQVGAAACTSRGRDATPQRTTRRLPCAANLTGSLTKGNTTMRHKTLKVSLALAVATLTLTATAVADAPPYKRLVWSKAATAWTAQAKDHGVTVADCSDWRPDAATLSCTFRHASREWTASLTRYGSCTYLASYAVPRPGDDTRSMFVQSQSVPICDAGWWKRLLSPWSPKR